MRIRNAVLWVILAACAAGTLLAADITGNWTGSLSMGDNQFTLTYAFKQDGDKLTGSVTGPQGSPINLEEGKVQGDKVSFSSTMQGPNGTFKITTEGTVKGDEITLVSKFGAGDNAREMPPLTIKRAK